jgi:hypothetical protein
MNLHGVLSQCGNVLRGDSTFVELSSMNRRSFPDDNFTIQLLNTLRGCHR